MKKNRRFPEQFKTTFVKYEVFHSLLSTWIYVAKKTYWGINWWLTSEFLESYKESDLREAVSDYGAYFMGLYYNKWYETKSLNKKDI